MLPLWEGFDEPFHYGYVEHLRTSGRFPEVNRTTVSAEIRASLRLTPVSWILHNALPGSISFDDWFRLPPEERRERRAALAALASRMQRRSSDLLNYEAQQAPLAYLLILPLDAAVARLELPARILILRLCLAIASTGLLFYAAHRLMGALGLRGAFRIAAFACIFESQMLWASIAHVGNDWLAIPLSTLFLALVATAVQVHDGKYIVALGAVLAAGLLTKAYFLAFVPVLVALMMRQMLVARLPTRAAVAAVAFIVLITPWYLRNLFLYGSLSGTQESINGIGFLQAAQAFFHINWLTSTVDLFRWALWTGNWSFLSFSRLTLNIEMAVATIGFGLFLMRVRQVTAGTRWVLLGCSAFFLGLVYQTCITWTATHGESRNAEPWYLQCILPALWAIVFLGCQRSGVVGRILGAALAAAGAWVAIATYCMKLVPYYGGFRGRATIPAVWDWWHQASLEPLSGTMLGPLWAVFAMLAVFGMAIGAVTASVLSGFSNPGTEVT
jgi:hypothetical protein